VVTDLAESLRMMPDDQVERLVGGESGAGASRVATEAVRRIVGHARHTLRWEVARGRAGAVLRLDLLVGDVPEPQQIFEYLLGGDGAPDQVIETKAARDVAAFLLSMAPSDA
jgi:hypothetical protein